MTTGRRDAIITFYENAALGMFNGLANRMTAYAKSPDAGKQRVAELFRQANL